MDVVFRVGKGTDKNLLAATIFEFNLKSPSKPHFTEEPN